MSEHPVEITETYTPGKNLGKTRSVTVERIPAREVIYEGITDTHVTALVWARVELLIDRALRTNDLQHQTIAYTPPRSSVPAKSPAPRTRPKRRSQRAPCSSAGQ